MQLAGLSIHERDEIVSVINNYFKPGTIHDQSFNELLLIMGYDKKGSPGYLNFSLLESLGKPRINCRANTTDILESFRYYNKISQH